MDTGNPRSGAEQALATLRDYVERSTHWREGGATRHDAKLTMKTLEATLDHNQNPLRVRGEQKVLD